MPTATPLYRRDRPAPDQPKVWLLNGPGKNSDSLPGWSTPVKGQPKSEKQTINVLLERQTQTLLKLLLEVLAPFPEARTALAAMLSVDAKPASGGGSVGECRRMTVVVNLDPIFSHRYHCTVEHRRQPMSAVYERLRLATFEVNLFIPKDTPERQVDQVVVLLNDIDLRRHIEETVLYHLRSRSFLKIVTAEVDE